MDELKTESAASVEVVAALKTLSGIHTIHNKLGVNSPIKAKKSIEDTDVREEEKKEATPGSKEEKKAEEEVSAERMQELLALHASHVSSIQMKEIKEIKSFTIPPEKVVNVFTKLL